MRSKLPHAECLEGRRLLSSASSLDPSFGNAGVVTTTFGSDAGTEAAKGIAVTDNGKIITASKISIGAGQGVGIARFNADGTPDTTFGIDGQVTRAYTADVDIADMTLESDGKILIAGTFANFDPDP